MTRSISDFTGRWQIERQIIDARAGSTAVFSGEAVLTPQQGGLIYRETGQLKLEGSAPITAERGYRWADAGDVVDVFFDDGKFFHRFELGDAPKAAHWCDPDQYDVTYAFGAWPVWDATWTVKGPRKDYTMNSRYSRSI